MPHFPVFIFLHKHLCTGLGRTFGTTWRADILGYVQLSSKSKGSGKVVCSSAWWKYADAGVSLLTKISAKGEMVPKKPGSGVPPLHPRE